MAIFLEGSARHASFNNWDVNATYRDSKCIRENESGTFWYEEEYDPLTNQYYPSLELKEQKPSGPFIRNVRKAKIGFSGVSLRVGVNIIL